MSWSLGKRVTLVCLFALVIGSPWVWRPAERLWHAHEDDVAIWWLLEWVFVPSWEPSTDAVALLGQALRLGLFFAALALFASRLLSRGRPGWPRCLATGVLASELSFLVIWALAVSLDSDQPVPPIEQLTGALPGYLGFGLVIGTLLALLIAGPPGRRAAWSVGAVTAPIRHKREGAGMAAAQKRAPVGSVPGDVTRYLCTAAYVDERFADRVVNDVLADEVSAVAPSPDIDLVAVTRHCLAAQALRYHRDLRLAGAFGVVALFAPLWLVPAAALPAIAGRTSDSAPGLATRGRGQPGGGALVRTGLVAGMAVLCAFTLGAGVSGVSMPGVVRWLLGAYLSGVPAVLTSVGAALFAYATVVRHDLGTDELLRTTMTREAFARQPLPPAPPREWITRRLAAIKEAQDGNVTVYSGYTPFIGYAKARSTWPLAVPLLPAEDRLGAGPRPAEPKEFVVTELVDHVRDRLGAAAAHGAAGTVDAQEDALRSLIIEDRIFANGATVAGNARLMPAPGGLVPTARLPSPAVEEIMLNPTGTVRHCLAVHVPLWGGDVVPSVFLHFSTADRTLHLLCTNHVLGPVDAGYHVVDSLRDPLTPERRRGLLMTALSRTGTALLRAPFDALRHYRFEARHLKRMQDELTVREQDPMFDYGARLSVRELALSPNYHDYFQVVDAGRIISMVERHTLAAIREFLDSRGFDTVDFRSQQQTILNNGLIQQGGMSVIGNQAIGAGASATQNVPADMAAGVPGR